MNLTDEQAKAIEAIIKMASDRLRVHTAVLSGWAGTGKTTAIRFLASAGASITVVAPTGKAALRVTEATGVSAKTIHRWMYRPEVDSKTGKVVFHKRDAKTVDGAAEILVVDEASMLSRSLWDDIKEMCETLRMHIVLVGDPFQLPPVVPRSEKPFSVFTDIPSAIQFRLTKILRQAEASPIIRASALIRTNKVDKGLAELERVRDTELIETADEVQRNQGFVICHTNPARNALNRKLRARRGLQTDSIVVNEPLLVLKNFYGTEDYFNGEIVSLTSILHPPNGTAKVYDYFKKTSRQARFFAGCLNGSGQPYLFALEMVAGEMADLEKSPVVESAAKSYWRGKLGQVAPGFLHANYGYAATCHKLQGSQAPSVLVVRQSSVRLHTEDGRRWLYTAVTRASERCAVAW